MEKKFSLPFRRMLWLSGVVLLSACSGSGSSFSYPKSTYTVTYYDDQSTPYEIGYTYVIPNGNASTMGHTIAYNAATSDTSSTASYFDYTSRSGITPSKVGAYWAFKAFAGHYADGSEVNLAKITGDCSVYATFEEKLYTYGVSFYNNANVKISAAEQPELAWGTAAKYDKADVSSYEQVNYSDPTLTPAGDWGYDFANPENLSDDSPDYFYKDDSNKKPIPSSWTFESGEAAPTSASVSAAGTLYAVTAKNDASGYNPTYPIYLSNGSEWLSIGSLSAGLNLKLYALYTRVLHSFSVKFYDQDPQSNSSANLKGEIAVPYTSSFTFAADGTTVSASYGTSSTNALTFASSVTNWKGRFVNCSTQERYSGKTVSNYTVMADCVYFPAA
jgi:hypothetical protein